MNGLFVPPLLIFFQKASEYLLIAFGGITLVVMNALLTNDVKNGFALNDIKRVVMMSMTGFVFAVMAFTFSHVGEARAQMGKDVEADRWAAAVTLLFSGAMLFGLLMKVIWAL